MQNVVLARWEIVKKDMRCQREQRAMEIWISQRRHEKLEAMAKHKTTLKLMKNHKVQQVQMIRTQTIEMQTIGAQMTKAGMTMHIDCT